MHIDVAIKQLNELITFFKRCRESGLVKAIIEAKEIALTMEIEPVFYKKLACNS